MPSLITVDEGYSEKAEADAQGNTTEIDRAAILDEYITSLHELFQPKTGPQLKRLIATFEHEFSGDDPEHWKAVPADNFGRVVSPGEMKPDEWPKYRYLMLELWKSKNSLINSIVAKERLICRKQVHAALINRLRDQTCADRNCTIDVLEEKEFRNLL